MPSATPPALVWVVAAVGDPDLHLLAWPATSAAAVCTRSSDRTPPAPGRDPGNPLLSALDASVLPPQAFRHRPESRVRHTDPASRTSPSGKFWSPGPPSGPPLTVSRASIKSGLSERCFEEADRYECHGQLQYMFVCYDFTRAKGMDYYSYADNVEFSSRLSLKLA